MGDSSCIVPTADSSGLANYEMQQVAEEQYCYANKGYSIKLSCDKDDTVRVDHWLDVTGKAKACAGGMIAGEPLMKDVPWEIAEGFFRGECTWSSEHGNYGKLTPALPESGYPRCDFTGASVRRLQGSSNSTSNGTALAPTPTPPTPTPPTPTPPTPTPPTATANTSTSNATANTTATPTPAPASGAGIASGASCVKIEAASMAGILVAAVSSVVV